MNDGARITPQCETWLKYVYRVRSQDPRGDQVSLVETRTDPDARFLEPPGGSVSPSTFVNFPIVFRDVPQLLLRLLSCHCGIFPVAERSSFSTDLPLGSGSAKLFEARTPSSQLDLRFFLPCSDLLSPAENQEKTYFAQIRGH